MSRVLPHELAIKPIFIFNSEGTAEVIDIKGVICDVLTVRGKKFDPSSAVFNPATIGGIHFADKVISSDTITFDVSGGTIDMGGATLTNVGGIVSNPNDYRAVYEPVIVPSVDTQNIATITIPIGNVVSTFYINFMAMSNSGMSVAGQLGYKTRKYVGIIDIMPCGYAGVTSDDPMLSNVDVTLTASGSTDVIIAFSNPTPLPLTVRITVDVTHMRVGGL
jgi:hypothetical protein